MEEPSGAGNCIDTAHVRRYGVSSRTSLLPLAMRFREMPRPVAPWSR